MSGSGDLTGPVSFTAAVRLRTCVGPVRNFGWRTKGTHLHHPTSNLVQPYCESAYALYNV